MLRNKLNEVEDKHAAKLVSALARIKVLEDEQKALKEKHDQAASLANRLEASKARKVAEVASLKRPIDTSNALQGSFRGGERWQGRRLKKR